MEKSIILKETIYEILNRDIPSNEEIFHMTNNEKIELEKQQQQIIELFRERIGQQLNFYQNKMNSMMNEIMSLDQLELDSGTLTNMKSEHQKTILPPKSCGNDKLFEPQLNEKITEIKIELQKLHKLSTYKRRKAWR